MSLIQQLKKEKLDIVGDIHGEIEALISLLLHLGYSLEPGFEGNHPDNRKLVFVGDLVDRGPNSPEVIKLVKKLCENENAQCILGNHEINLLQLKPKDGAGWYFSSQEDAHYEPFNRIKEEEKHELYEFLRHLPLALENDDLRIVHATWSNKHIDELRAINLGEVANYYWAKEKEIDESIRDSGLLESYHEEQKLWGKEQASPTGVLPFLTATADYNLAHQMNNPMRVVTSGVEQLCEKPFYASGKWRFVERFTWWNDYQDDKPVVVGHFWRRFSELQDHNSEVFENIAPTSWHGVKNNVFCVDYSVGGRFKERNAGVEVGENTKLVALQWPENQLVLETGEVLQTENFLKTKLHYKKSHI